MKFAHDYHSATRHRVALLEKRDIILGMSTTKVMLPGYCDLQQGGDVPWPPNQHQDPGSRLRILFGVSSTITHVAWWPEEILTLDTVNMAAPG